MIKHLSKYALIILCLCSFFEKNAAQNLVPDPGFEIWNGMAGTVPATLAPLTFWYNANGTADHHHQQNPPGSNLTSLQPCPTGQGSTDCGFPYEGQGVLGCWKGNGIDGTREWGGIKLTEPMVAGGCYKVSFRVQNKKDNPNFLMETNQWGIFFSKTQLPSFSADVANYNNYTSRFVACEEVVTGSDWQYFEFDYIADDVYEYAFVGYQGNVSASTFTAWSNDPFIGFYAWFDEIIIERINPMLTLSDDVSICPGDSVQLKATSNFPVIWENGLGSDNSIWVKPQQTTTYFVVTQDSTACSIRDSVVVTVVEPAEVDYPGFVCENSDPFQLDPAAGPGTWVGTGISDPVMGIFDPAVAGAGAFQITYESATDCTQNFNIKVEVLETPVVSFTADVTQGCPPLEVQFTDLGQMPGVTYEWNFGDGSLSNDPVSVVHTFTQTGSFDLSLSITYPGNCVSEGTLEGYIQVFVPPVANFSWTPAEPSNVLPDVIFEDASTGNIFQWDWDFGDGTPGSGASPEHSYTTPGIYTVNLVVTAEGGCQDSISRILTVKNDVRFYIPNAFSPNGDGINDELVVSPFGLLQDYKITVFNRWGAVVFESTDPGVSWDGTFKGKKVDIGVYAYLIEYRFPALDSGALDEGVVAGDVVIIR